MKYAQSGIGDYYPPGGVCPGHLYADRPDQSVPHMNVDCRVCEPHLAKDPLWAATPSEVPLTDREQRAADANKATFDAVAAQSVAALAAALAGGGLTLAQMPGAIAPAAPAPAPARRASSRRKTAGTVKTPA